MYSKILILIFFSLIAKATFTQVSFEKIIGTNYDEMPVDVLKDGNNFIIAGLKRVDSTQMFNTWLLKLDSNCDTIIAKEIFKPIGRSNLFNIIKTSDNNFMGFGSIQSDSTYWKYDFWVLKFDSVFNILEDKRYYTINWYPYKIVSFTDFDGNILVAGYSDTIPYERPDIFIYKVDLNGDTLKSKYFNLGPPRIELWDALPKKDSTGYYFICNFSAYGYESQLFEIDLNLNLTLIKSNVMNLHNYSSAKWLTDTTYLISGIYIPPSLDPQSMGIIIVDTAFIRLKTKYLGQVNAPDKPALNSSIDFINSDNIFFGGNTFIFGSSTFSYELTWLELFKINNNLVPIWQKFYGNDAKYSVREIIATDDGGCVMFCTRWDFSPNNERDIYILKVDENGILTSKNQIIKSSEAIVYPNPANDMINIKTTFNVNYLFEIYDLKGNKIFSSIEDNQLVKVDISKFSQGIYFYKLTYNQSSIINGKFVKF